MRFPILPNSTLGATCNFTCADFLSQHQYVYVDMHAFLAAQVAELPPFFLHKSPIG
jgi:hypothetical protein